MLNLDAGEAVVVGSKEEVLSRHGIQEVNARDLPANGWSGAPEGCNKLFAGKLHMHAQG
jgi:hypothetical protein